MTFCSSTSEKSIRICLWFMSKSYENWRQSEKTCSIYLPQWTTSFLSYLRKTIYRQQICENSCSICTYERKTSFVPFVRVHHMFSRILNFLFAIFISREKISIVYLAHLIETTKFPNSESPIFTTKFLFWFFLMILRTHFEASLRFRKN